MKGPSYLIHPPVLWDFVRRLRELDQEDIAVQEARFYVGRYLVVDAHDEPAS